MPAPRVAADVNAVLLPARIDLGQVPNSASASFARQDIERKRPVGVRMTRYRPRRPGSMESGDRQVP